MPPLLSIHLDFVRFSAALIVFLGHVSGQRMTGGLLWQFSLFMDQAVIVFFVLSGYVVAYATARPRITGRDYVLARASRILSVAAPALVVTFVLDAAGTSLRPDLYQPSWGYVEEGKPWQYLGAILFLGQVWWHATPVGSNLPYWSLHYEVWYYVIFGLAMFMPARLRTAALLAAGLIVGPPILMLLPIWLFGVLAYHVCSTRQIGRAAGWALATGPILLWVACMAFATDLRHAAPDAWSHRPDLVRVYAVGLLFAVHVVGVFALAKGARALPGRIAAPIRWAAGATFTLYLLHMPVAQFLAAVVPWPPSSPATRLVIVGGTFAIVLLAADVTERRKDAWQRAIEAGLHRLGRLRVAGAA